MLAGSREMLRVDVLFMQFSILTLFSGKMLPHEDIGIKVPFVQLLQVCLGKGEHSDQFPWYQKHFSHHANWKNGMKPFILTVNCILYAYHSNTLVIFLKIYMHNLRAFYVHFWFKIYFQCSKNEKIRTVKVSLMSILWRLSG